MLVTNDELGNRAKHLSTQTKNILPNNSFYHDEVGYNFRMPNILAAMGCAQLEKIEDYIEVKIKNACMYKRLLKDTRGVILPTEKNDVKHMQWLYSVLIDRDTYGMDRDQLIKFLAEKNIQTRPFFIPVHTMEPYKNHRKGDMSVTMNVALRGINLPSSVGLKEEEIIYICKTINGEG